MSDLLQMRPRPPEGVDPEKHQRILAAIQQKRLLSFFLDGKTRIAEPHDYGIQNGKVRLLAFQISGASSGPIPGWRWVEIPRMSQLELLKDTFAGNRIAPSGNHHKWDVLFARVDHSPETETEEM
ncbi:MAG TPA: hypothetical protein VFB79_18835 [Candidatus Angelobacter sp.]|nr:hypothetical protein [Candidatus Angelobacter sp.]